MAQVVIIVDGETSASPSLMRGIAALQQAINSISACSTQVATASIAKNLPVQPDVRLCPLTLALPDALAFPERAVYRACQDVEGLRLRVTQQWGDRVSADWSVRSGSGQFWLPVVLTAKGPLYAEVIHAKVAMASSSQSKIDQAGNVDQVGNVKDVNPYAQPLHLPDRYRQPLYQLGQRLLDLVSALPAVYLLQFDFQGEAVVFDRLFPFPAAPAIASLDIQTPNLFECHWRCLTHQPIRDLRISGTASYQIYQPDDWRKL